MKWMICGVVVLLAVAAVSDRTGKEDWRKKSVNSSLLTTIAKVGGHVTERQLAEANWYCYELTTLAEEPIAMSEVAIFAGGSNKEGEKIEVGPLTLAVYEDRTKGNYCVVASDKTKEQQLTPNNDKIKYMTLKSMKFYSMKVMARDPISMMEGFNKLKAILTKKDLDHKVHFDRPAVIYNLGETGGEILFPED